ncbi:hypothetical protein V8E52_005680 [Russula decolorans]
MSYTLHNHSARLREESSYQFVSRAMEDSSKNNQRPNTTYPGGPLDTVLATIARRIGGKPGQVIFKWAHAKGFVVVTTTSRRTRLHEYLDVVHLPDLIPEETKAIDEAGANGPPAPTPSWLRKLPCANVARIRVVLGVLTIPFAIMLLCCLGSPALL